MSSAKITLMGLYHFLKYGDDIDLFENLILPEGIDKDTLVANILQKGSEFEVIYPDAEYLQNSIKYWSQKWYWSFDKWVKLINIKYDPLYNYDRTEHWVDDNVHEDEHTINTKRIINSDGTINSTSEDTTTANNTANSTVDQTTDASGTLNSVVETTKSAFDSSSYQPYEKTTTDTTTSDHSTVNSVENGSSDSTVNNTTTVSTGSVTNSDDKYNEAKATDGTYKTTHDGRMFGNIGVMSSQDMFNQEIEVAYFNLYDRITEIFLNEYTIPIYV